MNTLPFEEYILVNSKKEAACLTWTKTKNQAGYGTIKIKEFRELYSTQYAHRMVYMYHYGPIPQGLVVMHSCDNRACVNKMHLSSGTMTENIADMDRKGRRCRARKLTAEKVAFIRRTKGIFSGALIAMLFNVTQAAISRIRSRKAWNTCTSVNYL